MKWQGVAPVLISILVIIAVAIVQRYSKIAAALTATMPVSIPLSLWIVDRANRGDRAATDRFIDGLLLGIGPSVAFVLVVWLAARARWPMAAVIVAGYAAWGLLLMVLFILRRYVGMT